MISINAERCIGCGACVAVCPTGKLYLVDGRVSMDESLCRDCQYDLAPCLAACPTAAIVPAGRAQGAEEERIRMPVPSREGENVQLKGQPAPVSSRAVVMPAVGAVLAWAGREIVPRLASYVLDNLDRRATGQQTTATNLGGTSPARRHRRQGRQEK